MRIARSEDDPQTAPNPPTAMSGEPQEIGRERVYVSAETLRLEILGRNVIHDLMTLFWEGVSGAEGRLLSSKRFDGKLYNLMSGNHRRVFESAVKFGALPVEYLRCQLVADYICGMTDTFALHLHEEMFG